MFPLPLSHLLLNPPRRGCCLRASVIVVGMWANYFVSMHAFFFGIDGFRWITFCLPSSVGHSEPGILPVSKPPRGLPSVWVIQGYSNVIQNFFQKFYFPGILQCNSNFLQKFYFPIPLFSKNPPVSKLHYQGFLLHLAVSKVLKP